MVEDIIKAVNHSYVYVSFNEFEDMLEICKEKLLACCKRNGGKFEAFFDCKSCDEKQLIELLKTCEQSHTLFLGFKQEKKNQTLQIYQQKIYSGDRIILEEDTMIIQDIPFDCYIECYGNLMVVGCIKGCIDFHYQENRCFAGSLNQARIRIFDSKYQILTSFSSSYLYYENNEVKREDNLWDVASVLPQVKVV